MSDTITSEVIPDVTPRTKYEITVEDAKPAKKQPKVLKPVEAIEIVEPAKPAAPIPAPLSAATLAEMEAGRAALQAIAAEKERLRQIVAKMAAESE